MTTTSWSTASNIPGPGRTVGKIISLAGRKLEKALAAIPEKAAIPPEVILHQNAERTLKEVCDSCIMVFSRHTYQYTGQGDGTLDKSLFSFSGFYPSSDLSPQVLLLGTGDSGKSSVLKVILIARIPVTSVLMPHSRI